MAFSWLFRRLRFSGWSGSVVEFGSWSELEPDEPAGDPLCSDRSEHVELLRSMNSLFLGTWRIFEPQTSVIMVLYFYPTHEMMIKLTLTRRMRGVCFESAAWRRSSNL